MRRGALALLLLPACPSDPPETLLLRGQTITFALRSRGSLRADLGPVDASPGTA
jgi:hypothetical protein